MASDIYTLAVLVIANISFVRFGWIVVGILRGLGNYRRAKVTRWGLAELLTLPEPFVLFGVTCYLFVNRSTPAHVGPSMLLAAVSGVVLALGGLVLSVWAFLSLPTVSVGHYVLETQRVVDDGPYGWVRHPIYLGVFLIWLAVSLVFQSLVTLLIAGLYVIPAYLLYMRSEEEMMAGSYGSDYVDYRRRVGMILPRLRRA